MADEKLVKILLQGPAIWNQYRQENLTLKPDLSGANLRKANLSEANLSEADLSGAYLRNADLRDAHLRNADLHDADLSEAALTEADLRGADLSGADLRRADLRRANLIGANLIGAYLQDADLSGADLSGVNLRDAHLSGATLTDANLSGADLRRVNLNEAYLSGADLHGANLNEAYLNGADVGGANLRGADLRGADLAGADLSGAACWETLFVNVRLADAKGLELLKHRGPSVVDHRTLALNPSLPLEFLRGCGLPDFIIDNRHVLYGNPIQFYSCFISYSSADEDFAKRLHNDLQGKGIRCWFAPEDLKTGDRFRDRINEAILIHDKLLLILSKNSIQSDWVETEVEKAFAKERRRSKDLPTDDDRPTVLFPVRVDEEIRTTKMAWADHIRNTRQIGDFTQWKDHDAYQEAFQRLLRDLRASEQM